MGAVGVSTSSLDVQPAQGYAGDLTPQAAWSLLSDDKSALLVDVRTDAEWNYVGLPDLAPLGKKPLLLAWQVYPAMAVNGQFTAALRQAGAPLEAPMLFLCRSGVRSKAAAIAATQAGYARCYNIADGFEGPLDSAKHRGIASGWKASGLPWLQK